MDQQKVTSVRPQRPRQRIKRQITHTYETSNPFTGESLASYRISGPQEAMEQVREAREAFENWCQVEVDDRAQVVQAFAEKLRQNKDTLARLMTDEMGKRLADSYSEIEAVAKICEYCAKNGPRFLADQIKDYEGGQSAFVSYRPLGVILSIQPWNFPLYQAVRSAAPNLIAGNALALKHAPNVWGSAGMIEELFLKSGLPKNVFTSLQVADETIPKLIEMDEVAGVSFTGSPDTGRKVAAKAGECLKKTVMELGGSDPYIVFEDADLERAAQLCAAGRLKNAGQTCTAAKRFIVIDKVYDKFRDLLVRHMKEAQMGDPKAKATRLGPLARRDLLEKLDRQVDESLEMGAVCLTGGHIEKRRGNFFQPTVLENLRPGMPAYDEELFGPVACLFKVSDEAEAIKIANGTRYGLGGGVFTSNMKKARRLARNRIESGMVTINGISGSSADLPFGGVKESGWGREHERYGFREFTNIKTVMIK